MQGAKCFLQLFAEGAAAFAAPAGSVPVSAGSADASRGDAASKKSAETTVRVAGEPDGRSEDSEESFERLIRGEYRQAFAKRVQQILDKRLRAAKQLQQQHEKFQPVLQTLCRRYGLDEHSASLADELAAALSAEKTSPEPSIQTTSEPIDLASETQGKTAAASPSDLSADTDQADSEDLSAQAQTGTDSEKSAHPEKELQIGQQTRPENLAPEAGETQQQTGEQPGGEQSTGAEKRPGAEKETQPENTSTKAVVQENTGEQPGGEQSAGAEKKTGAEKETPSATSFSNGRTAAIAAMSRQIYRDLQAGAQEVRRRYDATFDLAQACRENPRLKRLVGLGVDVRTAYEAVHRDRLMFSAMQYTASVVAGKTARQIAARSRRPAENGLGGGLAAEKTSVAALSGKQIRNLIARAEKGEQIRF